MEHQRELAHDQAQPKVLFVDDEQPILQSLARFARAMPWETYCANSGAQALELAEEHEFSIVISDMRMPGMNGDELLSQVREKHPNAIRILLTGFTDMSALESAINKANVYNFISKPWNQDELATVINNALAHQKENADANQIHKDTQTNNKKLSKLALLLDKKAKERSMEVDQAMHLLEGMHAKVEQSFFDSLKVLNHILEWKEGRDSGHGRFVAKYGEKLARKLKLNKHDIQNTQVAAMLHRVGLLCLPDELRTRPVFNFDQDERRLYEQYPVWGEMALSSCSNLEEVAKIIRHHRESVNGKGFPDGISDRDIPIVSKILAVVGDFYDLYNGRLERNLSGLDDAKKYIKEWVGKRYDTGVTSALWEVLEDFGQSCIKVMSVGTQELTPGMTLEADIVTSSGILLLTEGSTLTDVAIEHLVLHENTYNETFEINVLLDVCS